MVSCRGRKARRVRVLNAPTVTRDFDKFWEHLLFWPLEPISLSWQPVSVAQGSALDPSKSPLTENPWVKPGSGPIAATLV